MSLRPEGVKWIAILWLIFGVGVGIVLGAVCAFMSDFATDVWNDNLGPLISWIPIVGDRLEELSPLWFQILGGVLLGVGAFTIVTAIGLLKLKKWGYWLCIIGSIVAILIIVGIIFIWYLRKDEVKAAFDIM